MSKSDEISQAAIGAFVDWLHTPEATAATVDACIQQMAADARAEAHESPAYERTLRLALALAWSDYLAGLMHKRWNTEGPVL